MADWNSEQYLKFEKQRTQPSVDLVNRLRDLSPKKVVDLGCGPGNSTAVLHRAFPQAELVGIDSSPNMIEKARASYPSLSFSLRDLRELDSGYDLLFSNACLQWLPDHETLLPRLMEKLNPGGVLAVQVPYNPREPLFQIIHQVAADPAWGLQRVFFEANEALTPRKYFEVLSRCSSSFTLWETVYHQAMPSHQALLEWVRSTRLRPYLQALSEEDGLLFQEEILRRAEKAYPLTHTGEVILPFNRLFFTAVK